MGEAVGGFHDLTVGEAGRPKEEAACRGFVEMGIGLDPGVGGSYGEGSFVGPVFGCAA